MDRRNSERVADCNGIQNFWSFGQSEIQKLISIQPPVCPEAKFSSKVELQNIVTSKPFSGQSRMSNG
jgi:hypothetical protein